MTLLTAYGSELVEPSRAAALLRATASRHGVDIKPVTDHDAAVAVLATDLWMRALGIQDLSRSHAAGPGAMRVLTAALLRAAGHGETQADPEPPGQNAHLHRDPVDPAHLEALVTWVEDVGLDPLEVASATSDLLRLSQNARLEKTADLLDAAAGC